MVHIIMKEGKNDKLFYIYDNVWDDKEKKYKKVYLGTATESDYARYKKELEERTKSYNYCQKCGNIKKEKVPKYLEGRIPVCRCD